MGTMIQLSAADGHKFAAYRAEPNGKPRGALVVVQEIFGVNKHIKELADGFAADGYLSIAPAFFERKERGFDHGYTEADIAAGRTIAMALNWDDTMRDLAVAIDNVKGAGKVGIIGYCWGGTVCWVASARANGLACSIPFYGGGITNMSSEKPKVPVQMHWGHNDHAIPLEGVWKLEKEHPSAQSFVYADAGHGFTCDHRGSYHEPSKILSRTRAIEFLHKHVG